MSNRIFNAALALEKQVCCLFGYINSIGTAITYGGLGITSVARTGVGAYTITLDDSFDTFLFFDSITAHQTDSNVMRIKLKHQDTTMQSDFRAKTLNIVAYGTAGTAIEPASNSTIYFSIKARRSSSGRTWSF
jgi:hypothetical protein